MAEHNKYDIFISYRRDGGAQYARILQLELEKRGYKVFLDYEELTDGVFGDNIKEAIREAPIFMMVLSAHYFDRCKNEGDWVREEIMLAIKQQKHFIPINPDNAFNGIPVDIPEEIKQVVGSHQHSEVNFGQLLGASIDRMVKNRILNHVKSSRHMERKVFISYSRRDLKVVKKIKEQIEDSCGTNCWMDLEGIESGNPEFTKAIVDGINECQVFLFMLSYNSQDSTYALGELNLAYKKAKESNGKKKVVMVNIDNCDMTDDLYLLYSRADVIDWGNKSQQDKFLRDIVKWTESRRIDNNDITGNGEGDNNWYSQILNKNFHPLMRFLIAFQILFYGITFFNFVWTLLWGCLAFYHDFQISLCLLCCSLFLSLFSTTRLRSCKILWWALVILLDYISAFYLCVVSKYLYTNWSSFSSLQIPSSMRYRLLYFIGESMGDSYFIHPYLLLFAVLHTILIFTILSLRYKGKTGWQIFK